MDIPEEITTDNPKELISFYMADAIDEGIIPQNFKMSSVGYDVLDDILKKIWEYDDALIAQVVYTFLTGYAVGSEQVGYRGN